MSGEEEDNINKNKEFEEQKEFDFKNKEDYEKDNKNTIFEEKDLDKQNKIINE